MVPQSKLWVGWLRWNTQNTEWRVGELMKSPKRDLYKDLYKEK